MGARDEIWDKDHAKFMKGFVAEYKAQGWSEEHEVPYNWYGQRGWIDVLLHKGNTLLVCELKPKLENVGETIRQIKQAQEVFLKALPSYKKFDDIQYLLVLKANDENLRLCKKYFDLLKDLDVFFWSENKEKDKSL